MEGSYDEGIAPHWTVQVLQGRIRYTVEHLTSTGWPGDLLIGSSQDHEI